LTQYVGNQHATYPYSAVSYIEVTFPDGSTASGSGAVVGQNDVLTASHVIYDASAGGLAKDITVYPGRDGSDSPYGSYEWDYANYFEVDQDGDGLFTRPQSADDVAIIGFDERIADETGEFELDPNGLDGDYHFTGYPAAFGDPTGPRMTDDVGPASVDASYSVFNFLDGAGGIEAFAGNSGGPLWYQSGANEASLVGIASTGEWATDIWGNYDLIQDWIDGNDTLLGGNGGGDGGDDRIDEFLPGDPTAELIYANDGADTVYGAGGGDEIYGNQGNDRIFGEAGDDRLFGGQNGGPPTEDAYGRQRQQQGTETVSGGSGDDLIYGNYGSDLLQGGFDDDTLFGGQGSDTLVGGAGDDLLWGNRGSDTLTGGLGADTMFALNTGNTFDDFFPQLEGDRIATVGGFDDLTLENTAAGLELEWNALTGPASVTLPGWTAADFSSDWLA